MPHVRELGWRSIGAKSNANIVKIFYLQYFC